MTGTLEKGALSLTESIVMGVAGSAPGFSVSAALGALIGTAGVRAPSALVLFALPMIGIAVAYKGLSARFPSAGAGYEWAGRLLGKPAGFASGWALLVATAVFVVTGSSPMGAATLALFDPQLADNVILATSVGTAWFLALCIILMMGISYSSKVQLIFTFFQIGTLTLILLAAAAHVILYGAVTQLSWSWLSIDYDMNSLASSALIAVFFYWGWDVTANLEEEAVHGGDDTGVAGFISVIVTIGYFVAFSVATLTLFDLHEAQNLTTSLVYRIAEQAGLGRVGTTAASLAVLVSAAASMESLLLQLSRTLFAMGRDRSLPQRFGIIDERTHTPMNAMYLIVGLGILLMISANFIESIDIIIKTSVNSISLLVAFYYGLAGIACGILHRDAWKYDAKIFLLYAVFPIFSALCLFSAAAYALSIFDNLTRVVGLGGLVIGVAFYRPRGYRETVTYTKPFYELEQYSPDSSDHT